MPACPLVDCHTHTSFSDGHASFEDNVRAAAAAGCRAMVSTDHLTLPASMDSNCEVQVVEGNLPAHRLAFEDARKLTAQIAPELELIYGFECDWYEGCEPLVERWSEGAVVRLGSVHWIGNPGDIMAGAAGAAGTENVARPDTPDSRCGWIDDDTNLHVWENLGVRGVWERYVDDWCRACESSLNFDVMAHPDLVMRFRRKALRPTLTRRRFGSRWPNAPTIRVAVSKSRPPRRARASTTITPRRGCCVASPTPRYPSPLARTHTAPATSAGTSARPRPTPTTVAIEPSTSPTSPENGSPRPSPKTSRWGHSSQMTPWGRRKTGRFAHHRRPCNTARQKERPFTTMNRKPPTIGLMRKIKPQVEALTICSKPTCGQQIQFHRSNWACYLAASAKTVPND